MKLSHESGRVGAGQLFNRESELRNPSWKSIQLAEPIIDIHEGNILSLQFRH